MAATPSIDDLILQASAFRREQRMEEALELLGRATKLVPNDPRAAFGFAQTSFECWRPAADLFAAARRLIPDQPDLVRNHALALAAEGEVRAADELLDAMVAQHPLWLDGHRALANLRITHSCADNADASYRRACSVQPDSASLWLSWFQHHAIAKDWARAGEVLDSIAAGVAVHDSVAMARIFLRSESGDDSLIDADFKPFATRGDPGFDLCHIRYLLRRGAAEKAAAIALRQIEGPQARSFWPYLSLCWRLMDDPKAAWLDGEPLYADAVDLDMCPAELGELADVLRKLHRLKAPYPEQSVRGGTQTDRQLFFHPDPAIQKLRTHVTGAIRAFASTLPPAKSGHPLLDYPRDQALFDGSWSVRLSGGGHHASHTHVKGWISSAFYVHLPDDMGDAPSGCLALGAPPPELGLDLQPYRHVMPKAGRLAIFPSTMWHATEPFAEGERLTVAFDIAIPT